ncbi:DNA-binding transcriptional regulator, AcrR family [Brevibacterium siliguriense]|uniref:DNA-binding transcriptional regulator, AcrR family n=1 Tax=Brevibacterium siliguriense TaxID=1136497 RepID=A0A1H1SI18_9MICO|nr:TetR/AcrR family transcriptional regulator [Brevibacterium siliguriense]SDS47592.1 DNA-binding transcriptional regulator, AcrR family [Brevibacterium siliguriense]
MTETPRQRARIETEAQITAIGNRMVDEGGVDGLSLRAIARELGVVSSAVYRYVKSRDELLTILIRDAFTQIADAVDEALAGHRSIETLALAMLTWSQGHPNRWALIYGTPIAGYEAPREETVVPGTRIMVALASLVAESTTGTEAGPGDRVESREAAATSPTSGQGQPGGGAALQPLRDGLAELGLEYDDHVILDTVTIWVAVVGLINGLRFGQFGPGFERLEDELMSGVIGRLGA